MGDAVEAARRRPDAVEVERGVRRGQDGPIVDDDEDAARLVFLAARFSLRLCCAFFRSVFWEPLSLFATVASSQVPWRF
jgi:hypothetical protein